MSKYIIAGHEDGSVSQYDGKTGELLDNVPIHELNQPIVDLQWAPDRTLLHHCLQGQDRQGR
ncbi:translation initiation factor eIF3 subunit [Metarhizium acridum]|nr:translation initiation factor eIF3 subunit [Metarhizium acridum]